MIKINENFEISKRATYELISPTFCKITSIGALHATASGAYAYANADGAIAHATASGAVARANADGAVARANASGAVAYATASGAFSHANASGAYAHANSDGAVVTCAIAYDGKYRLYFCNGRYFAGCQVNLTKKQALAHWDRDDDRALLFTLAIHACTP